jgi:two-component system NtrC family sensor kinase
LLPINENGGASQWRRLGHSLSTKLILLLLGAMVVTFGLLGWVNIRLHRQHLEAATLAAAARVGDVMKRSTSYHMLRNDRQALYRYITTVGAEPGMVRVRIFDKEGRISFSSDPPEVGRVVDKRAEACYGCHAQMQPLTRLDRPDRFRIFKPNGERVLAVITPIENQPECSNAACHAHPAEQKILGVFDTHLSLAQADTSLAQSTRQLIAYTIAAVIFISIISGIFVVRVVGKPVRILKQGTQRLGEGDLGYQIHVDSEDEVGDLALSFNQMSLQLRAAHEEITSWAYTLEERVEEKTGELKRAHEHMLHVEKMASIGKMAAVVAHEVNNPLSGILTYSKLLKKWLDRGDLRQEKEAEFRQCLDLIESESRRCGELVKNLLMFSRAAPMNLEWANVNAVVERCLRLVMHQAQHLGVQIEADLEAELPALHCDPGQVEQVVLAMVMNALDAMPRGGNLWVRTRSLREKKEIEIQVRDDGAGIAPALLPKLFEPFTTTKETGKGVGLGLAISRSIVERHKGRIEVESELGRGTTFFIFLPTDARTVSGSTAGEEQPGGEAAEAASAR